MFPVDTKTYKKTILSHLLQQQIQIHSSYCEFSKKISTEICRSLLITKGRSINYYKHMYIVSLSLLYDGYFIFFVAP